MNGNLECSNGSDIYSVCTYQCLDGYALVGSAVLVCEDEGEWDQSEPSCEGKFYVEV